VAPGREDEWIEDPVHMVTLALIDLGRAVLFRTGPKAAFSVFKDENGRLCRSATVEPRMYEPDGTRLARRADGGDGESMMENRGNEQSRRTNPKKRQIQPERRWHVRGRFAPVEA
jgi:hypothetical protein